MAFFVEISLKKQHQILNHMVWRSNIVWFCRRHNKVENQSVDIERLCVCAYVESKAFLESHKTATAYYGFWTNFDISIFLFFFCLFIYFLIFIFIGFMMINSHTQSISFALSFTIYTGCTWEYSSILMLIQSDIRKIWHIYRIFAQQLFVKLYFIQHILMKIMIIMMMLTMVLAM